MLLFECFVTWSVPSQRTLIFRLQSWMCNWFFRSTLAGSPIDRRPTTSYLCFFGGNFIHERAGNELWFLDQVQNLKIERWQMLHAIWFGYEILWLTSIFYLHLLWDYTVITRQLFILQKILFHKGTKHIKVDCHVVRQKVMDDKNIETRYVTSAN